MNYNKISFYWKTQVIFVRREKAKLQSSEDRLYPIKIFGVPGDLGPGRGELLGYLTDTRRVGVLKCIWIQNKFPSHHLLSNPKLSTLPSSMYFMHVLRPRKSNCYSSLPEIVFFFLSGTVSLYFSTLAFAKMVQALRACNQSYGTYSNNPPTAFCLTGFHFNSLAIFTNFLKKHTGCIF